jgi:hypothetical protein
MIAMYLRAQVNRNYRVNCVQPRVHNVHDLAPSRIIVETAV